jgi:hypothetical protein
MIRTTTGDAYRAIATLAPFSTSGALAGHNGADWHGPWHTGRLSESEPLWLAIREGRASYVVTSYATPIAAIVDGAWLIAGQRFSVTTSRHQSAARHGAALSGLPVAGAEVAA